MGALEDSGGYAGQRAFEELFDRYYADILAYALRRTPTRSEAEDLAAETFAVAWRRREDIPEQPLAWLYRVAALTLKNQRRSGRRRARLWGRLSTERRGTGRDPAAVVGEQDSIARAFSRLSESHREVLRLSAWEELDTRSAALALGCTTGTYAVRLHRARRELAKYLTADGHEDERAQANPPSAQETQ